jgi:predicted metal-dependent phosphotriesterase family hydrolase
LDNLLLLDENKTSDELRLFYGGHGYAHILENAVPAMKRRDLTEEQIMNLLVNHPARFFTI